jgi:cytochrome c553
MSVDRAKASTTKKISMIVVLIVCGVSFYLLQSKDETPGQCPQTRSTIPAPEEYSVMQNMLQPTKENLLAGNNLFNSKAKPVACSICHGLKGDGIGLIFPRLKPYPRNFTCYQTVKGVSDGQLFWIIKNGSHGTNMPGFVKLEDKQIWQLILHIRSLTN